LIAIRVKPGAGRWNRARLNDASRSSRFRELPSVNVAITTGTSKFLNPASNFNTFFATASNAVAANVGCCTVARVFRMVAAMSAASYAASKANSTVALLLYVTRET